MRKSRPRSEGTPKKIDCVKDLDGIHVAGMHGSQNSRFRKLFFTHSFSHYIYLFAFLIAIIILIHMLASTVCTTLCLNVRGLKKKKTKAKKYLCLS